jgi:hypothetical protein
MMPETTTSGGTGGERVTVKVLPVLTGIVGWARMTHHNRIESPSS